MAENETVWKMSIGTVAAIVLGIISITFTTLGFWVNTISTKVSSHGEEISALKQCFKNVDGNIARMNDNLDEIRKEQLRRKIEEERRRGI